MKEITVLNVQLDPSLSIATLPPSSKLRLEGDQSHMSYFASSENASLQSRFEIEFEKLRFSPLEYSSLKLYLDEVESILKKYLVIKKD